MDLQALLSEKNMTMYHLSKISGIPKTTIIDICSGKSAIEKCSAKTVYLIAKALDCTVEEMLEASFTESGKPSEKTYLECLLPEFLARSLQNYKIVSEKQEKGEMILSFDCYYCELQSDINSAQVNHMISEEQAWYLRSKYLGIER